MECIDKLIGCTDNCMGVAWVRGCASRANNVYFAQTIFFGPGYNVHAKNTGKGRKTKCELKKTEENCKTVVNSFIFEIVLSGKRR